MQHLGLIVGFSNSYLDYVKYVLNKFFFKEMPIFTRGTELLQLIHSDLGYLKQTITEANNCIIQDVLSL